MFRGSDIPAFARKHEVDLGGYRESRRPPALSAASALAELPPHGRCCAPPPSPSESSRAVRHAGDPRRCSRARRPPSRRARSGRTRWSGGTAPRPRSARQRLEYRIKRSILTTYCTRPVKPLSSRSPPVRDAAGTGKPHWGSRRSCRSLRTEVPVIVAEEPHRLAGVVLGYGHGREPDECVTQPVVLAVLAIRRPPLHRAMREFERSICGVFTIGTPIPRDDHRATARIRLSALRSRLLSPAGGSEPRTHRPAEPWHPGVCRPRRRTGHCFHEHHVRHHDLHVPPLLVLQQGRHARLRSRGELQNMFVSTTITVTTTSLTPPADTPQQRSKPIPATTATSYVAATSPRPRRPLPPLLRQRLCGDAVRTCDQVNQARRGGDCGPAVAKRPCGAPIS